MGDSRDVKRKPVELTNLLHVAGDDRAVEDLRGYFQPDRAPAVAPVYSGSRFEFFAGGGDRPATTNQITVDDLVAVTLLAVDVPGDVALRLLEGDLGQQVSQLLTAIPTDVAIDSPEAAAVLAADSPARQAYDLLEKPRGMGWVITSKLLARKRPQLLPVYDRVVRCSFGRPAGVWNWLLAMFAADGGVLAKQLQVAREAARVPAKVSALRVLDVIVWMRHRDEHQNNGTCAGLVSARANTGTEVS